MRSRRRAIDDLRRAVESLPRTTRVAMLHGMASNDIIVGAYTSSEGICPMLAAHRSGGRTSFAGFAVAWDRFASTRQRGKQARRATARELLILKSHLEASLLDDETRASPLEAAIAGHRELVASRPAEGPAPRRRRPRPGEPDRSPELRRTEGWAWSRLFRRYDDYQRALRTVSAQAPTASPGEPQAATPAVAASTSAD